jgi:hypothetical protein
LAAILYKAEQETTKEISPECEKCETPTPSTPLLYFDDYVTIKARDKQCNKDETIAELKEHISSLRIPDKTVKLIEFETRGQSSNEKWIQARHGRITASNFHAIRTKMQTLDNPNTKRSKDTTSLISLLMGYNPVSPNIPALQYGRETEATALDAYRQHQASLGHKSHVVHSCGLFVSKDCVFLGASPDGLTSCECCGQGIVEIKCPSSVKEHANVASAECLAVDHEGNIRLKRTDKYYTQIQGQLAIVGVDFCDFVVYNPVHIHVERIRFDQGYWKSTKENLRRFYMEHLLPECVTHAGRPLSQIDAVRQTFQRANFMGGERNHVIPEVASNVTII